MPAYRDELLKDADPKKVFGSEALLDEIKKALAERTPRRRERRARRARRARG
jgi:hypothetical protein